MNIIFQIEGGLGNNVVATAVCKAIKRQYAKDNLLVITNHPEVFFCNPNVDKVLTHSDLAYFYSNCISGKNVKMFLHSPYNESTFISGTDHLIKVWCEMYGIKYNGEQPELFINRREQNYYSKQLQSPKPIMVIQTNGGMPTQPNKYSWVRDMPISTAGKIVSAFADKYNIVHIRREDQLQLPNTTPVQAPFRQLAVLISISEKRLFIDSFAQHAAAAMEKPSVTCWIGTDPVKLGYELHTNIVANPPTLKPELRQSVYSKYDITGQITEFPYNSELEIFNPDEIIDAINSEGNCKGKSGRVSNLIVKDKIEIENNKGSMVAHRLSYLTGKVDLDSVNQILDIGSWHLNQSIEFSNIFKSANIDAFEPVPDSFRFCVSKLDTLDEQKKKRIKVHNLALTSEVGEIPFYAVDPALSSVPNVGASSMFKFIDGLNGTPFGQNLVQNEIRVKANTLDCWCEENNISQVDIMWVDVQGSELLVFKGAEKILSNTRIIMTEVGLKPYYEGHTLKKDIDEFLFGLGFRELEGSFELNGFDYEANTIYIKN